MTDIAVGSSDAIVPGGLAAAVDLVAVTVPLAAPPDLLAAVAAGAQRLFLRDDVSLAGWGAALRIRLPEGLAGSGASGAAVEALGLIETHDEVAGPGCGPVAMGALPFDREEPSELVVPAEVLGFDAAGRAWRTTVRRRADLEARSAIDGARPLRWPAGAEPSPPEGPAPEQFSLRSVRSHQDWSATAARAIAAIRAGKLDKVVLARDVTVIADRPFPLSEILGRLRALYPSCLVFLSPGFLGASPELLVARRGTSVRSHPLAGTVGRTGDDEADARAEARLLSSPKERSEHRFVVDAVAAGLAEAGVAIAPPVGPELVRLRNVSHLGTLVDGTVGPDPGGGRDALGLAAALHPTPAVAGSPRRVALDFLRTEEGLERDCYGGPVGWVDRTGDGEWWVAIRSAAVDGNRARLFAGVGLVAGSDPAAELAETQLKLQALLAALVRP